MGKIQLRVKSVIFDMDGVITNTMPDHYRAWKKVLRDEGIKVTYEDVYLREGQKGLESVCEIFTHHRRIISRSEARKILKKKERLFKKIVKLRFVPGARKLLKALERGGFVLGLVTGTSRHELRRMLPKAYQELFTVTVTGCDVEKGKPNPEPYRKALKNLKLKPQEAVVIENAPFGIESAKKAGLKCVALETSLPNRFLRRADYIFMSIKAMDQRLEFSKT